MKLLDKLAKTYLDLMSDAEDFDTRDKYLVANIKTYTWLDEDDILTICKTRGLSEYRTTQVRNEFYTRLEGTFDHCAENEVNNFREILGSKSVCYTNYYKLAREYSQYLNGTLETYTNYKGEPYAHWNLKQFQKFQSRNYTYEKYLNYLKRKHKTEMKEYEIASMFDPHDVYTFGRSGGWLSFAPSDFFEDSDAELIAHDPYDNWDTSKEKISILRPAIQELKKKIEAANWILNYIKGCKEGFKDYLISELDYEIGEYLSEEFTEDTIQATEETIKTSRGVTVGLQEAKTLLPIILKRIEAGEPVNDLSIGVFKVVRTYVQDNENFVQIGCHNISLDKAKLIIL